MRTGAAPLLEIEGSDRAVRRPGRAATRSIWRCRPQSVVAVIGPNGSGKSTLFNAVTGLVPAEEGSIRFAGEEIARLPPHYRAGERGIARTFQNIRLFPNLTVLENVLIGLHARLRTGAIARAAAPAADHGARRPRRASGRWRSSRMFGNRLLPRVDQIVREPVATPIAGASRSPARSRRGRASCCSTSRPPA